MHPEHNLPILVQRSYTKGQSVSQPNPLLDELNAEDVPKYPDTIFLEYEIPLLIGPDNDEGQSHKKSEDGIRMMRVMSLSQLEQQCVKGGFPDDQKNTLLDQTFPPVNVTLNKKKWRFYVSKTPAGAAERLELTENFESQERNVLGKVCGPITNSLVHDVFDECIRREILHNPERGLLLAHCRNGFNRIIQTYSSLTETVQLKGMRTDTTLNVTIDKLQKRLEDDDKEIRKMQEEIKLLQSQIETQRHHHADERRKKINKYHEELEFLKNICQQFHLSNQLGNFDKSTKGPSQHVPEEHAKKQHKKTHTVTDLTHNHNEDSVSHSQRDLLH